MIALDYSNFVVEIPLCLFGIEESATSVCYQNQFSVQIK